MHLGMRWGSRSRVRQTERPWRRPIRWAETSAADAPSGRTAARTRASRSSGASVVLVEVSGAARGPIFQLRNDLRIGGRMSTILVPDVKRLIELPTAFTVEPWTSADQSGLTSTSLPDRSQER